MADLLALSWNRRRLCGIELTPDKATPRIISGFSVEWPEQPPTSAWLRETLRKAGVNAKQVVLAFPREDAVLRMLELPQVSDDELPTLVRFQAAARSAQSLDQLLLDYLPLPLRMGVAQREVWLATALLTAIDPIRQLLTQAGLELIQLTLSSICLTELIARVEALESMDPTKASLVVLRDGSHMELAVVSQRQLIAAHSVKWSSASDIPPVSKMLAEVSRTLVQIQAWLPEGTLQNAWVIGEDADVGELPEAIRQRWGCQVERFDPWKSGAISLGNTKLPGPPSDYAIPAGLALLQAGRLTPKLDLLHPRQPPPKRNPRKPLIAAASSAALLLVAIGTAVVQRSLASYDVDIAELLSKETNLSSKLKAGESTIAAANEVNEWQMRNIDQLKQMSELYEVMDGTDRLLVSEYRYGIGLGKSVAKINVTGLAKDRVAVERLTQNLADKPRYEVRPSQTVHSNRDHDYANQYSIDLELVPVTSKPTPNKPGPAAAGPTNKATP